MSTETRLITALLVCILLAQPACQLTAPAATSAHNEAAPPRVAASAPATGSRPTLVLGSAPGRAGGAVGVSATLNSGGASIAGTQNDITFNPAQIAIAAKANGKPNCTANPQLGKEGTAFSFLPAGCRGGAGGTCTGVRALVLSLGNVDAIPNASALYTCTVQISPQAPPGALKLSLSGVGFSTPSGQAVDGGGLDGAITVAP